MKILMNLSFWTPDAGPELEIHPVLEGIWGRSIPMHFRRVADGVAVPREGEWVLVVPEIHADVIGGTGDPISYRMGIEGDPVIGDADVYVHVEVPMEDYMDYYLDRDHIQDEIQALRQFVEDLTHHGWNPVIPEAIHP